MVDATVRRATACEKNSVSGSFHQAEMVKAHLGNKITDHCIVVRDSVRTSISMVKLHE